MSTTFSAPAQAHNIPGYFAAGRLLGTLKRRWMAYMAWRIEEAAIASLRAMSDRELKDIGLTRPEIGRAVRGEMKRAGTFGHYW